MYPLWSGQIPPALWATGGLEVVNGKLPLSLPSLRASDLAGLEVARAHIAFSKVYELPSESLQKCDANWRVPFFVWASGTKSTRNTVRGTTRENLANTDFTFFYIVFFVYSPGRCRSSLLHTKEPHLKRSKFWAESNPKWCNRKLDFLFWNSGRYDRDNFTKEQMFINVSGTAYISFW